MERSSRHFDTIDRYKLCIRLHDTVSGEMSSVSNATEWRKKWYVYFDAISTLCLVSHSLLSNRGVPVDGIKIISGTMAALESFLGYEKGSYQVWECK